MKNYTCPCTWFRVSPEHSDAYNSWGTVCGKRYIHKQWRSPLKEAGVSQRLWNMFQFYSRGGVVTVSIPPMVSFLGRLLDLMLQSPGEAKPSRERKGFFAAWEKLYSYKSLAAKEEHMLFSSLLFNISGSNCVIMSPNDAGNSTYSILCLPKCRDSDTWPLAAKVPTLASFLCSSLSHILTLQEGGGRKGFKHTIT